MDLLAKWQLSMTCDHPLDLPIYTHSENLASFGVKKLLAWKNTERERCLFELKQLILAERRGIFARI